MILEFISKKGDSIEFSNKSRYVLTGIKGVGGVERDIYTVKSPFQNGVSIMGERISEREIEIEFAVYEDERQTMKELRRELYRKLAYEGYLRIETSDNSYSIGVIPYKDADYTWDLDNENFMRGVIRFLCPNPFFINEERKTFRISFWEDMFSFPTEFSGNNIIFGDYRPNRAVSVFNAGDTDTGVIIKITARDVVFIPKIENATNGSYLLLDLSLYKGDYIIVNTRFREKSAFLYREEEKHNVFSALEVSPGNLFKLSPGYNAINCSQSSLGKLDIEVIFQEQYCGV